jgi:hypothetical protein
MGEPGYQTANFDKISAEMGIVELVRATKHTLYKAACAQAEGQEKRGSCQHRGHGEAGCRAARQEHVARPLPI